MSSSALKKRLTPQELKAVMTFKKSVEEGGGPNIHRLLLFGSRARGEGTEDSDIDILVLLSKMDDSLKVRIWDIAHRIFCDTEIMISPLVLSGDQYERLVSHERLITKSIQKEGIEL